MSGPVDFFVSYTGVDGPWAEWIVSELEAAGYSTRYQARDMPPGSNFVVEMDDAATAAERTVAILSPASLASGHCRAEWAAARRADPEGKLRKLVPVRVRECDPGGLLGSLVYVDVVGLSEAESRERLLAGVQAGHAKAANAAAFPGRGVSAAAGERVRRPDDGAAIFNVPVATHVFTGRERELERVAEGLADGRAVAVTQVAAIHGLGGVGKTQLAARYARLHRDDYDVIWWLRAERPVTLRADLATLAVALGLVDAEADEPDALAAAAGWLARHERWLVVFDNVTEPAAIAAMLPEGDGGRVLITSRAHADWRSLNARPIALDVWEREESREFLTARTGEQDAAVLDAVAEALGGLPLALEQAAAFVNAKAITLAGYLERLRDRAAELLASGRPAGYEHTVATVWSLAFEQLAAQPLAEELARVCAHLAPERIPRELLEASADPGDAAAAAAVDDAIELLLSYALLIATADNTFAMHRLVQDVARSAAGAAACGASVARAVALVDRAWPGRPWEHEQWPPCARLLEHALSATRHAGEHAARELTPAVLVRVGQYQRARAAYATARELYVRALAMLEAVHGPEHPEVAVTLTCLGIVQAQVGELEAAGATLRRALAIEEAVHGPEHPGVASTLTNLGNVQLELRELEAGAVSLQRALAIQEAVYGPEHPDVASTLTNLGIVQRRLGDVEAAGVTLRRALAIKEAIYGSQHPAVAVTLTNLGNVQLQLGELDSAAVTLRRALAIDEAVYGPEHPAVAFTLSSLARVRHQLGERDAAREHAQRAAAIFEASLGSEHPYTATARNLLASLEE